MVVGAEMLGSQGGIGDGTVLGRGGPRGVTVGVQGTVANGNGVAQKLHFTGRRRIFLQNGTTLFQPYTADTGGGRTTVGAFYQTDGVGGIGQFGGKYHGGLIGAQGNGFAVYTVDINIQINSVGTGGVVGMQGASRARTFKVEFKTAIGPVKIAYTVIGVGSAQKLNVVVKIEQQIAGDVDGCTVGTRSKFTIEEPITLRIGTAHTNCFYSAVGTFVIVAVEFAVVACIIESVCLIVYADEAVVVNDYFGTVVLGGIGGITANGHIVGAGGSSIVERVACKVKVGIGGVGAERNREGGTVGGRGVCVQKYTVFQIGGYGSSVCKFFFEFDTVTLGIGGIGVKVNIAVYGVCKHTVTNGPFYRGGRVGCATDMIKEGGSTVTAHENACNISTFGIQTHQRTSLLSFYAQVLNGYITFIQVGAAVIGLQIDGRIGTVTVLDINVV